ncbi:hypothetical protein KP509_25G037900, partial [Ceratopteris richardii]
MDMGTRAIPLQTLKTAVQELFDLYLGGPRSIKNEDSGRDSIIFPTPKRVSATSKPRTPNSDQSLSDFKNLQSQFPDQEQLRIVVEPMLATLLASCSAHMVQVEFLLSVVQTLSKLKILNWDSFLILLLKAALAMELSGQGRSSVQSSTGPVQPGSGGLSAVSSVAGQPSVGMLQVSPPPPASPASARIGSPSYSSVDPLVNQSPAKVSDHASSGLSARITSGQRSFKVASWLRQVVCKVILLGTDLANLHPLTCLEVLSQIVQWINSWDVGDTGVNLEDRLWRSFQKQYEEKEWLYSCLKVIRVFINESKGLVPFYALLHNRTQVQIENWPDNELLFDFYLEVHQRRDRMASLIQSLDQHLQCPTFATA